MEAEMEVGTQVEMEEVKDPSPPFSPVAETTRMRRLRKVMEVEIEDSDRVDEVGVVAEKSGDVDARLGHRGTAEEILMQCGKGGDVVYEGGKKRKTVQSTTVAAVGDMAKQAEVEGMREDEDGGMEVRSQGEELAVESIEMALLRKSCSAHATGLTFESAARGHGGDVEISPGIDGEVKKNNQEGSDSEDVNFSNEDIEDGGGASDSEKLNEGNEDAEDGLGELNTGWSDGWAGEGLSMDIILEKARKMVAEMSKPGVGSDKPSNEKKNPSEEALTGMDDQNGKKKKSKKEEERIKREVIYAESQRLLRESKGVAFVAPAPVTKPIFSVLEKIRQRRLQLGCSGTGSASSHEVETESVSRRATKERSITHVDLTVDGDTEVEIEMFSSNVVKIEEIKTEEAVFDVEVDVKVHHISTQGFSREKEDVQIPEADGKAQDDTACDEKSPGTPEGQDDLLLGISSKSYSHGQTSSKSDKKEATLKPSKRIMTTQDLLCTSQLSPATQESFEVIPFESVVTTASQDFMGLDSQLLDEDLISRAMRDEHYQDNKLTCSRPPDQSEVYTTATHIRGLIDDEAEDEDEDMLTENADEVALKDKDDLQDLIATTNEKASDKARRDALHRKWLEQQDTGQTEDILERLPLGRSTRWKGRDRVVSCLDDDDDRVNCRDSDVLDEINLNSQTGADGPSAEKDHIEEPSVMLQQRMRSREYEDIENIAREEPVSEVEIIEDEEEHEQSIIRKRLLEESEEQLVFTSPSEDESSREVLSLISKVNVANLKTKFTAGDSEIRAFGSATSSSLPSRLSFLGRSSSSSLPPPPAHRQIGSGGSSRSFVFGRDDSNSGHGFPSNQTQEEKKPGPAKSAPDKGISSTSTIGGKKRSAPQSTKGPSLFEMLKNQSKEHGQDLKKSTSAIAKKWSSNTEAFSMFATNTASRRKLKNPEL